MQDQAIAPAALTKQPFTTAIVSLGQRIELEWHRVNYDDTAFEDIAERVLIEERLHERYDPQEIVRECLVGQNMIPQIDARATFGQPPITFFRNRRFYVAVLFWVDSTTSIHEHGFSGAFSVLSGSSLHARYDFTPTIRVNSRLSVGKIERKRVSILERGAVQRIVAGPEGAHALFHLERPSVTILVRTHVNPLAQPQMTYHWPHYAIDPFFEDNELYRKCQLLRLVQETDKKSFRQLASDLLTSLDLESAVRVLLYLRQLNVSVPLTLELASVAAHRFGELGEGLVQLVEAGHHETRLVSLRRRVFARDHRLLLAFLLNRISSVEANGLIARRYPDKDPAETLASWTISLLEDVGGMESSTFVHRAIRLLLTCDRLASVKQCLAAEFDIVTDEEEGAVALVLQTLSCSPLLSSLFAASGSVNYPDPVEMSSNGCRDVG